MLKLCFYVPQSHLESVKNAIFDAGAGCVGEYDRCAWEVLGAGQFRPSFQASPFVGKLGELTRILEYRVETLVDEARVSAVVAALKAAHPYEEPAFDVVSLVAF